MRPRDSVLTVLIPLLLIPVLVNIFTADFPEALSPLALISGILAVALSVLVAVSQRQHRRVLTERNTAEAIADDLAAVIGDQWSTEARVRELHYPAPLTIEWQPLGPELVEVDRTSPERPANQKAGESVAPAEGRLARALIHEIPSRRLVVLGPAGSGKTAALVRLTLDLVKSRQDGAPVPFLVSAASWNPDQQGFRAWLIDRLIIEHPGLAASTESELNLHSDADLLVTRSLILPLIDGLDEIPAYSISKVLTLINQGLDHEDGLVVSCRSAEYHEAVHQSPVRIHGAAGIKIQPLHATEVVNYLERGASRDVERWRDIFAALRRSSPLAETLQTPLMVALARTMYAPTATNADSALPPDPRELTDESRFPTAEDVRLHLLNGFIGAAYRPHPERPQPFCTAEKATRWLTFIARHQNAQLKGSPNIAWWQLARSVPKRWVGAVVGVTGGLLSGIAAAANPESGVGLGAGLVVGLTVGRLVKDLLQPRLPLPRSFTHRSSAGLGAGLVGGLLGGIVAGSLHPAGITVGVSGGLGVGFPLGALFGPFTGFIAAAIGALGGELFAGRGSGPAAGLINGVMTAIALGLVVDTGRTEPARGPQLSRRGLYVGAIMGLVVAVGIAARTAHGFGLAVSIVAGIIALVVIGLVAILSGTPADLKTIDPRSVLVSDRWTFLLFASCGAFAGALTVFAGVRVFSGIVAAFAGGFGLAFFQATWGRFRLAHLYLAVTGKLPWRLMTFLQDAHKKRGVLRQVGPVYQFKHADLQNHLAPKQDHDRPHGPPPGASGDVTREVEPPPSRSTS